jgi:methylmalonyl-CoA mutase cobalamin-binding domain/chain
VVSEQDYHATTRAAMFEQLMDTLNKLPPEIALKLLPQILELSDIPNKDEFITELRQLIGAPKPSDNMTPEEIVAHAVEKKAHAVGLSILSGSHLDLVRDVVARMRAAGLEHVPVVVGGIIPPEDARALKQFGVAAVYTPKDFKITEIMGDLVDIVEARVEQLV